LNDFLRWEPLLHCLEGGVDWERRHLGGATGPPGISPFIGVADVPPATGTTGVPPVVKGTKQATQNPRAITVRNHHAPQNRPVFCISCLVTVFSCSAAFIDSTHGFKIFTLTFTLIYHLFSD